MDATTIYCATCGAANPPDAARCFACGNPPQVNTLYEFIPAATAPTGAFSSALPAAQPLKQRYRLLRQVGTGGFGAVYQAQDTQLGNRLVAVKEMSQRGLTPEELREATANFQREALLLASLHHPNLPHIYEQFEEGGRWYLVMEFIEGETLEARLGRAPTGLSIEETLQIGLQLSKALGYLHSRTPPIIFRDLKPANIMLTPDGQVYLIDFGIARLFKPGQTRDTESFGSAGYAAPEQYGKAQTTAQSDIYGLGATLHHLLSGDDPSNHPFLFKPLHLPAAPALAKLVMWMLEQDYTQRPSDMLTIERELQRSKEEFTARQKRASASTVLSTPQTFAAHKASNTPTQRPVIQPTASQGGMTFPLPTERGISRRDGLKIAGLFASAVLLALVIVLVVNLLPSHPIVQTGDAVPYIQISNSPNIPSEAQQDTFHVGDTVYLEIILDDTRLTSIQANLFLSGSLMQSDTVPTGEGSASFSFTSFTTPNGTVSGISLGDSATVTQTGTYIWEVDDDQGNFEASITFQVTS